MLNLKLIYVSMVFLMLHHLVSGQNTNDDKQDLWSGKYTIKSYIEENNDPINSPIYAIEKTADEKVDNIAGKYETDLLRWTMINQNDLEEDSVSLRRFLMNDEDNEYEEFGWTELYNSGKMKCLDGGHFFICKTTEGSNVKIGEEAFISKTGLFGIMLHQGFFELHKIKE